jgi:hypothetical protein
MSNISNANQALAAELDGLRSDRPLDTDWEFDGAGASRRYYGYWCCVWKERDGFVFRAMKSGYDGKSFFDKRTSSLRIWPTIETAQLACDHAIRYKEHDEDMPEPQ